jgi:hypothetical protein
LNFLKPDTSFLLVGHTLTLSTLIIYYASRKL